MGKYDEVVNVVRYVRPPNSEKYEEWETFRQNLYGITILYSLDYKKQVVKAKWSVCKGDNFDKDIGKAKAESSKKSFEFPLGDVDIHFGLTMALVNNLVAHAGCGQTFVLEGYETLHNLFSEASRSL